MLLGKSFRVKRDGTGRHHAPKGGKPTLIYRMSPHETPL